MRAAALLLPVAALLLAAGLSLPSCDRRGSQPAHFDCEAVQRRAEQCEGEILKVVRRGYEAERVTMGTSPEEARKAYRLFKIRFQRRLRERDLERECRELAHPRDQAQRKRASGLRYCFSRPTCRAFGECLLSR